MEDYILFSICTLHRSAHKWEVNEDGLVDFFGDMITPREAFDRFLIEYTMFTVVRADVSRRRNIPNGVYSYTWNEIERFK
ncbi:MAG TPA: hypothetical protein VLB82_14940 [Thermodesulfobacteriota bacterium]|nr:hypothetical protein [Thermodesulfobacteriota bacterium]